MNGENRQNSTTKKEKFWVRSAKECAYIAVFVALVIAAQFVLSAVPGVEVVTVFFIAFAFSFGTFRGVVAAIAFSLLRQFVFGFFPTVLLLYLLYYNLLAITFGTLGKGIKEPLKRLWLLVLVACVCTVIFTLLDDVITPLWYGYSAEAARAYFYASLPFMLSQTVCTAVTTATLFLPLFKAFEVVKRPFAVKN